MKKPTVFALDFDGVLCNSAAETCAAAWRAGRALWSGWEAPEPPPELVARFRKLRHVLETGYQAIALLRLAEQEQGAAAPFHAAAFAESADRIFAATGLGKSDLVRLFGDARDQWLTAEPDAWLARHEFYAGVPKALNAAAARGCPLFILTTKQQRFTKCLLHGAGVLLPQEHIFGLESGRPKDEILKELLARPECRSLRAVFVEDRAEALDRAAAVPELAAVELRLALWGYCGETSDDTSGRIRPWTLPEFTAALRG